MFVVIDTAMIDWWLTGAKMNKSFLGSIANEIIWKFEAAGGIVWLTALKFVVETAYNMSCVPCSKKRRSCTGSNVKYFAELYERE